MGSEIMDQGQDTDTNEKLVPTKKNIRDSIFSSSKMRAKSKVIPFFDTQIEIRQPTLGSIMKSKAVGDDTNGNQEGAEKSSLIDSIIDNAYVPGSDEKVFDPGDFTLLKDMPFGSDIQLAMKTVAELSDINFTVKNDGSVKTDSALQ